MLLKVMIVYNTLMDDKSWFHHCDPEQNNRAWNGITHHPRKRSQKQRLQPVTPWELSVGMLQDVYWSLLLVTFRHSTSCAVHCMQLSMEKIILQHNVQSHTIFMCEEAFKRTPRNFSPIQSGPSLLRQPFVSIFKELEARQVPCDG